MTTNDVASQAQETTSTAGSPATSMSVGRFVRDRWNILAPFVVLVLLLIGFSIVSPLFFTPENLFNILRSSAVLMVVALGTTVVVLTGGIDLSVGSTLTLSAYVGAMLANTTQSGNALIVVPLIGLACGLLNGLLVSYARLPSFLVTLGGYFAYDGIAGYISNGQPITLRSGGIGDWFQGSPGGVPALSIWAIAVLVVVVLLFRYTRLGRYIFAVGGNERTAKLVGVPASRVKFLAFAISGLLAGFAALMQVVRTQSASAGMGSPFLLLAIGAVVMGGTALSGGIGGPLYSMLGVLVISILSNGMVLGNVNPYLQNVILGSVVVAAVAVTKIQSRARDRNEVVK